jgi:predicted transglutaminase-like cysteine proteinase
MTLGQPVAAPAGYLAMCERQPDLCDGPIAPVVQDIEPSMIDQTASLRSPNMAWAGADAPEGLDWSGASIYEGQDLPRADETLFAAPQDLEGVDEAFYEAPESPEWVRVETIEARTAVSLVNAAWVQRWLEGAPVESVTPSDAQHKALLDTVNAEVNRAVRSWTDEQLHGVDEYWSLPQKVLGGTYGDCEDYALEKRRRLIKAGLPAQMLSLAVVFTPENQFHAVLVVKTESGDWVLDNLQSKPVPWHSLGYLWVQRQVAGGSAWATLQ